MLSTTHSFVEQHRAVPANANGSLVLEQCQVQLAAHPFDKVFGPFHFDIRPGEKIAILGPSGAGKSTLLKLLSGELIPQQGRILYSGYPLQAWQLAQLSRYRAVLAQQYQVAAGMQTDLLITLGRVSRKVDPTLDAIIEQAAHLAHATHLLGRRFETLSGGEQARIHLARIFAQLWDMRGGIILVDEPLAALDPGLQIEILESLDQFVTQGGHAIVAVLHDINHALQGFDRLLLVKDGQLQHDIPCNVEATPALSELFEIELAIHRDHGGHQVLAPIRKHKAAQHCVPRAVPTSQQHARVA